VVVAVDAFAPTPAKKGVVAQHVALLGAGGAGASPAEHGHAEPELDGHGELGGAQVEPQCRDGGAVETGPSVGQGQRHQPRRLPLARLLPGKGEKESLVIGADLGRHLC